MKKRIIIFAIIGIALLAVVAVVLAVLLSPKTVVPDVTGKTIVEATSLLKDAQLKIETENEYSDTVAKNMIVSQNIEAGKKVRTGSTVIITISAGRPQTELPDVTKLSVSDAENTLKAKGFKVKIVEEFSDHIAKGKIISQSKTGDTAEKGSEIILTISKGPDLVIMPNIKGLTLKEAEEALDAVGLHLETKIKFSSKVKEGRIISQDVAAADQISRGSLIFAEISAGVANKKGNTPSNAGHWGRAAEQGNWIYFCNAGADGYLYRMTKDGSKKELITEQSVVAINVVGEWIYYADGSSVGGIYKIKLDGSEKTQLSTTTSYMLYVEGDWIYYTSRYAYGSISKMKTDGSSVTEIVEDICNEYIVYNGWIYYIKRSDSLAYKCRTDGSGATLVCPGFGGRNLSIAGGKLVTANRYDIQSVNLDGSGLTQMGTVNVQPSYLNGNGGWIYYLENDMRDYNNIKSKFYKIKPDGSQKTFLMDYDYLNRANFFINIVNGWLYFPNEHDNDMLYRIRTTGGNLQRAY